MHDHAEALPDITRFGPVGPVEAPWPARLDTAPESGLRCVLGVPLGLAITQEIHTAEVGQLLIMEIFLVAQGPGAWALDNRKAA